MSFKISNSYTTCSVWLTFCIVAKKVQWSCTLKIPWKKKYLYWRNMLLYIPSNKKQYSCKGKYNLWKQCNTFFNEVWPHCHFFSMAFAFNKGISLLQKELPWRQDNFWNRKARFLQTYNILANTRHSWWNEASPWLSCITFAWKERIPLLKNDVHFFSCFNHMEGILHTCSHISLQNKYTSTSYFL